eukprot:TRINITY_DN7209_c0_g1_i2.p1 TRINITY_DN7209_c0_g1~~TRINITY_DN7209_c0_g1_i2.p1  ORF type:complete len:248 (-),score=79.15 TRINITY_DN7209_c0_g1_i2:1157-1900(-)
MFVIGSAQGFLNFLARRVMEELFGDAASVLKALGDAGQGSISNEILLELYSLFKQGSEGDCQGAAPSVVFAPRQYYKWQAWNKLKGLDKNQAKQNYVHKAVEIVFGFDEDYVDKLPEGVRKQVVEFKHKIAQLKDAASSPHPPTMMMNGFHHSNGDEKKHDSSSTALRINGPPGDPNDHRNGDGDDEKKEPVLLPGPAPSQHHSPPQSRSVTRVPFGGPGGGGGGGDKMRELQRIQVENRESMFHFV